MRWICWLLIPVLAACGEEPSFPETRMADEAVAELEKTPVVIELKKLTQEIEVLAAKNRKEEAPLREKATEIYGSKEYREYQEKRRALENRRNDDWQVERRAIAAAAKKIYAARHEELRTASKADLLEARKLGLDLLTYPRVDGSTSTGPLSVIMASRFLNVPYEWIYPEPTGSPWTERPDVSEYMMPQAAYGRGDYEFMLATLKVVAKPASKEQERVAMLINSVIAPSTSTHDGYVNLVLGKSDLNLSARLPSESELKLAKEKGVNIVCEPIARDAFVFLVHSENPIKSLPRDQVRAIYEQKIKTWKEVGGDEGDIRAFRRQRDSGSRELFDALVMDGAAIEEGNRFNDLYANSMGGPFSQLTRHKNGLAYSIYYYEHFMAASPHTRTLAIDDVEPTAANIESGKYPWVTHVYAVYRAGTPEDAPTMKLVKWLLSDEGQGVVRESGYVPGKPPVQAAENMKN